MPTSIYQNSYIVFAITFVILCAICYIFEIGFNTSTQNGKVIKSFSWKYPLAISLIVWLFWHFYLFPSKSTQTSKSNFSTTTNSNYMSPSLKNSEGNNLAAQKFTVTNWT